MKTELYICDGCGKRAKLGPLPKGARNHYCDCNPAAPFYMVPERTRAISKRVVRMISPKHEKRS